MGIEFDSLTTPTGGEGSYRWDVPDGWQQGRGAFGGLVLATVIRALENECESESQTLRTVSAVLCGPVEVGAAQVDIELLRAGSSTTAFAGRISQGGEVKTQVTALFGSRRVEDGDWNSMTPPPELGDWRNADVAEIGPPLAPIFAQNMQMRPISGFPFSGGDTREVLGWVRPRSPGEKRDAAYLAANLDAYWPAPLVAETGPRPMATVAFQMEIVGTMEGLDREAPLFHRASSPAASGGYTVEFRELWGADGRLLALNQQSFCIIK